MFVIQNKFPNIAKTIKIINKILQKKMKKITLFVL